MRQNNVVLTPMNVENSRYSGLAGINVNWHDPEELIRLEPVHPVKVGNISSLMNNEANSCSKAQRGGSANIQQKIISQLAPVHSVQPGQPIITRSLLDHPSETIKTGKKSFKCQRCACHCDCLSASACHLNNNERVHTGENEKPFKCSYCNMKFPRSSAKQTHEKKCNFKSTKCSLWNILLDLLLLCGFFYVFYLVL